MTDSKPIFLLTKNNRGTRLHDACRWWQCCPTSAVEVLRTDVRPIESLGLLHLTIQISVMIAMIG